LIELPSFPPPLKQFADSPPLQKKRAILEV
jgi:hypothetical protein